ncbi:lysoplasmalogenase [Noviherbaspirillum cavernae]|uniref:Lysoplasmalogenase n=1 Tax=Noviherbaspirillum cavernae TaxID=2320862 RepID=A0A418X4F5_9BURK|nr:lysoplasmalogenase [Noviherbaspirillum cavernae]RJG07305.1 lysoplasmalogenase [Noviherbaspirillum cavernae]
MRSRSVVFWTLGIALCGLLAILGSGAQEPRIVHYVFKPLATALIFLQVWRIADPVNPRYRRAVLTGIALSLCGDVFLMLPKNVLASGFLLGLGSFLVAHLFFLRALTSDARLFGQPLVFPGLLLVGGVNLAVLWPGLAASLKAPVVIYMLCLVAMVAQAICRHLTLRMHGSLLAAVGGILFLLSDTLLAYNKFYAPIPLSALWVLATYYTALLLIARSVAASASQP